MNIGILGSGFGVYGYLPAVCENDWNPILLSKARSSVENRTELKKYQRKIKYVDSEKELMEFSNRLVIARNPERQIVAIKSALGIRDIQHFYLEKPLTDKPSNRREIIDLLSNTSFSLAYLMVYTTWFSTLKKMLQTESNKSITITWEIPASDTKWKSSSAEGGGLLFYYAPHLLAILFNLDVAPSQIVISEKTSVQIIGIDKFNNTLNIKLAYSSQSFFSIKNTDAHNKLEWFNSETPFGVANTKGSLDNRISVLRIYLNSPITVLQSSSEDLELYISRLIEFK